MLESLDVPDDLPACQQLLRELFETNRRLQQVYEELLATCTNIQDSQLKLEQEKEELEQTIKELMNRLYGRRTERYQVSPDQLSLAFDVPKSTQTLKVSNQGWSGANSCLNKAKSCILPKVVIPKNKMKRLVVLMMVF